MARSPYRKSERSPDPKRRDREKRNWRDNYDSIYRENLQRRSHDDRDGNSSGAHYKRANGRERKYSGNGGGEEGAERSLCDDRAGNGSGVQYERASSGEKKYSKYGAREDSAERSLYGGSSALANKTPLKRKFETGSPSVPIRPKKRIVIKDDLTDEENIEDVKVLKLELKSKIQEISKLKKNSELKQKTLKKTENLEQRNKKLSEQLESFKTMIAEEKEKNEVLKNEVEIIGKREAELEKEKARMAKASTNSREECSKKLTEEIRRLRREVVSLKEDFEENESYLRRVRFDRDNLRVEKKKLESRVENLERMDKKGTEEDKIKAENNKLKNVIEEKSKTLDRIRSERNNAKHDSEASKVLIKELNDEKGKLEKTFKDSQNFWTNKEKEIEDKLDDSIQDVAGKVDTNDVTDESDAEVSDDGHSHLFRTVEKSSENLSDPEHEAGGNLSHKIVEDDVESAEEERVGENNFMSQDMFDSTSIFMASDEEWADDFTRVNNIEVFNYKNPKDCAAKSLRAPQKYISGVFRPTVCCLNNMVNFVAISSGSSPHNTSMKGACGLKPFCNNTWVEGTRIAKLYIFGTENHPNNETEKWCCSHHSSASCKGFQLQTQTNARKKIQHFGAKAVEDNSAVDGVKALPKRISNRLSLRKKVTKSLTSPPIATTYSVKQGTTPS